MTAIETVVGNREDSIVNILFLIGQICDRLDAFENKEINTSDNLVNNDLRCEHFASTIIKDGLV